MQILEVAHYDARVLTALNRLLPQLSSSASPLTEAELRRIIDAESSHLLMAEVEGELVGSLTLAMFRIPTGVRAWIEDVVVSDTARGHGVGRALNEHAIALAKRLGVKTLNLTSRPSREAANALYQKIGFKTRETNVYRYDIE